MKLYNLTYINGEKVIETILHNRSKALCLWKRNQLEESTNYKNGKLIIERNESTPNVPKLPTSKSSCKL